MRPTPSARQTCSSRGSGTSTTTSWEAPALHWGRGRLQPGGSHRRPERGVAGGCRRSAVVGRGGIRCAGRPVRAGPPSVAVAPLLPGPSHRAESCVSLGVQNAPFQRGQCTPVRFPRSATMHFSNSGDAPPTGTNPGIQVFANVPLKWGCKPHFSYESPAIDRCSPSPNSCTRL